ncbi:unnamed protein product, partial [Pylaiella littoralis]
MGGGVPEGKRHILVTDKTQRYGVSHCCSAKGVVYELLPGKPPMMRKPLFQGVQRTREWYGRKKPSGVCVCVLYQFVDIARGSQSAAKREDFIFVPGDQLLFRGLDCVAQSPPPPIDFDGAPKIHMKACASVV